jgi:hypothetical protein
MLERKKWVFALATVLVFAGVSFASAGGNYAGTYNGVFTGPDNYGAFVIMVNPDGSINGTGRSQVFLNDLVIQGNVQSDGSASFSTVEGANIPINFNGRIDFMNRLLGRWTYQDNTAWGSFNGLIERE